MGAKTLKRLAILFSTVLVAGLSIFWLHQVVLEKMDQSVLAKAARHEEQGKLDEAEQDYQEHLEVVEGDLIAKRKLADVLLKGPKDPARCQRAAEHYEEYVKRFTDDKSALLTLARLQVEINPNNATALGHLQTLAKIDPENGEVHFLLGQCLEAMGNPSAAKGEFEEAILHHAPQHVEASARFAALLLSDLNKADDETAKAARQHADKVIQDMVNSDLENAQVYLERGKYRRLFGKTAQDRDDARKDFELARQKNHNDPQVYLELSALEQSSREYEAARGHRSRPQGLTSRAIASSAAGHARTVWPSRFNRQGDNKLAQ